MRSEVYDASSAMRCKYRDCLYDTDEDIKDDSTVGDKLHLLDLHVNAEHPPAQPVQATSVRKKPEKFLRPEVGVGPSIKTSTASRGSA